MNDIMNRTLEVIFEKVLNEKLVLRAYFEPEMRQNVVSQSIFI